VLSCVQGGFFLRKKPLGILLSLYSNGRNALSVQFGKQLAEHEADRRFRDGEFAGLRQM
jgi:hypothetical protein